MFSIASDVDRSSLAAALARPPRALRRRRLAARRRRLVLRARDWLGIGVVVGFGMTLFALTFFSLIGR